MKLAECHLRSLTPYSQSKFYETEKEPKELPGDYEKRTWRDRCHANAQGHIIIPPMALCNSVKEAAKYLSIPIPGAARQTFTKHFEAGVLALDPIVLPVTLETVKPERLFVPSDGKRGGGRRVMKIFPRIDAWEGKVTFHIMDDIITRDVFKQVVETAGQLIGIGRFRPRNMGYYGRFELVKMEWVEKV